MRRRSVLSAFAVLPALSQPAARRFHVSLSVDALDRNPGLRPTVHRAGVTAIWLAGFLYGHWYHTSQRIQAWPSVSAEPA